MEALDAMNVRRIFFMSFKYLSPFINPIALYKKQLEY